MQEDKKPQEVAEPDVLDKLFSDKAAQGASDAETPEKGGWLEMGGTGQDKIFKRFAIGSFIAGILIGGVLIFFLGKYM